MNTNRKNIAKLHYITNGEDVALMISQTREVLAAGGDWVQLRMKGAAEAEVLEVAKVMKAICKEHHARLIINDHVGVAKAVGADGVHLGQMDMAPGKARAILGDGMIIGGTANNQAEAMHMLAAGVDYIGLGPYRFTSTKANLSPVLGLEGIGEIVQQLKGMPVIAIGGIQEADVPGLMQVGVHGVAVSSVINQAESISNTTRTLLKALAVSQTAVF